LRVKTSPAFCNWKVESRRMEINKETFMPKTPITLRFRTLLPLFCLAFMPPLLAGCTSPKERVVLYCAQDKEFAEGLLNDFTERDGLPVHVKYDTEADKSVSLYTELVREKDRPRCDVHWNNEIIGTIRLQRQGVLEPYDSPSAAAYPAINRATDHTWTAFAAEIPGPSSLTATSTPPSASWRASMAT